MKPLVLALSAVCLALAVAACGGGGAKSAGPAPSLPVATAPQAASPGNTTGEPAETEPMMFEGFAQGAEYSAQVDAACKAAEDRLEAALELDPTVMNGESGYLLASELLAELRALPVPEEVTVIPVALCSHRGGTQESVNPLTRAEYIAQANTICSAASDRLDAAVGWGGTELGDWAAFAEAAARIEEEALAELRALPQPEADRALLEEAFYPVVEQEIDALHGWAAAAAAGDTARAWLLSTERVHLTHQRDAFLIGYGLGWCPVPLPA